MQPTKQPTKRSKPLRPDQVEYLSLEGGGGKGFAYVGAAEILEILGVMKHVKGFAGASAGSIFALLLSIGYDSKRLLQYMENTDFDRFFEPPEPRLRPAVGIPRLGGGYQQVFEESEEEKVLLEQLDKMPSYAKLTAGLYEGAVRTLGPSNLGLPPLIVLLDKVLTNNEELIKEVAKRRKKPPFTLLEEHWKKYIAYMGRDMGLFSGQYAVDEFRRVLTWAIADYDGPEQPEVTFEDHWNYFRKELIVTGTNLSTGRTQIFSRTETPKFPVADAIRISMSLPFFFKPYVITEQRDGWPECGTYVDGGVWNNLPYREFDAQPNSPANGRASVAYIDRTLLPRTLGLRLEITPTYKVDDFGAFLGRLKDYAIFGTGESQVLSKYVDQMILLDTRGLDLIDFNPPKDARDKAIKRARRATWRYFFPGTVRPEDQDPSDDKETEDLLLKAQGCQ